MTYEIINLYIVDTTTVFKNAVGQFILFILGMVFSFFIGLWLLPYVFTLWDLVWYFIGMIVPLVPFMVGMEEW